MPPEKKLKKNSTLNTWGLLYCAPLPAFAQFGLLLFKLRAELTLKETDLYSIVTNTPFD